MTALVALDPQKTMFQPPVAQVRIELIAHESWQHGISFAKMCEECVGVLLDDCVQQRAGVVDARRPGSATLQRLPRSGSVEDDDVAGQQPHMLVRGCDTERRARVAIVPTLGTP